MACIDVTAVKQYLASPAAEPWFIRVPGKASSKCSADAPGHCSSLSMQFTHGLGFLNQAGDPGGSHPSIPGCLGLGLLLSRAWKNCGFVLEFWAVGQNSPIPNACSEEPWWVQWGWLCPDLPLGAPRAAGWVLVQNVPCPTPGCSLAALTPWWQPMERTQFSLGLQLKDYL